MKKLLFIIAGVIMFSSYAFAQIGYNKDVAYANFELGVAIPILIIDPGTINLGVIAPGTTVNFATPSLYRMAFQISGGANLAITVTGAFTGTDLTNQCTMVYTWQDYTTGPGWADNLTAFPWSKTLDASGNCLVGILPSSVTANANATAGVKDFEVSITATYANM